MEIEKFNPINMAKGEGNKSNQIKSNQIFLLSNQGPTGGNDNYNIYIIEFHTTKQYTIQIGKCNDSYNFIYVYIIYIHTR